MDHFNQIKEIHKCISIFASTTDPIIPWHIFVPAPEELHALIYRRIYHSTPLTPCLLALIQSIWLGPPESDDLNKRNPAIHSSKYHSNVSFSGRTMLTQWRSAPNAAERRPKKTMLKKQNICMRMQETPVTHENPNASMQIFLFPVGRCGVVIQVEEEMSLVFNLSCLVENCSGLIWS